MSVGRYAPPESEISNMKEQTEEQMKKVRERFMESCKRSKKSAAIHIVTAALVIALLTAAAVALAYGALQALKVLAVLLVAAVVFMPDSFERMISKIGEQPQPIVQYPVYFGYEDYRIVPNLVDRLFKELYGWFSVCYFSDFSETPNRVIYAFRCSSKPDAVIDYDFILLLQKIAEHILSRQLSDCGFAGIRCQNLVALDIVNENLMISFAKNDTGIQETLQIQEQTRRKYLSDSGVAAPSEKFTDRWDKE